MNLLGHVMRAADYPPSFVSKPPFSVVDLVGLFAAQVTPSSPSFGGMDGSKQGDLEFMLELSGSE